MKDKESENVQIMAGNGMNFTEIEVLYTKGQNVVMGRDKVCDCVWERTGCSVAQNRTEYVGRERGEVVLWERIRLYCVMWEGTECV